MDIKEELKSAIAKRQEIIDRINQIEQEKQRLLQAALREDGKIELLTKLAKEEEDASNR